MPADAGDGQRAGFVLALAQRRARRCVGERWILGGDLECAGEPCWWAFEAEARRR